MKHPFLISSIFHVIFIFLVIFGLPHFNRPEPFMVTEVPIEIIDISDLTQLKKKIIKVAKKKEVIKKPKKTSSPTGDVKQIKKLKPKPKEVEKELIKIAEKQKVEKKTPSKKEKTPLKKQKTPPKKQKKPDLKHKKNALDALFKDLDRMKEASQTDEKKIEKDEQKAFSDATHLHVDRMTLSEKDALIYQIQSNWHYVPGSFENVSIFKVMIQVSGEGEVQSVRLLDTSILSQNAARACFESIKRAIFRTSPLSLPMDKKPSWSDGIRVTVDPQHVQIF